MVDKLFARNIRDLFVYLSLAKLDLVAKKYRAIGRVTLTCLVVVATFYLRTSHANIKIVGGTAALVGNRASVTAQVPQVCTGQVETYLRR